jgi:hypothetical protein
MGRVIDGGADDDGRNYLPYGHEAKDSEEGAGAPNPLGRHGLNNLMTSNKAPLVMVHSTSK